MSTVTDPDIDVPPDEEPDATCPYCDRPFTRDAFRDLHLGEVHGEDLTDAEREAHAAAVDAEDEELFMYHLRIVAGIAVIYAVFVLVYMVVLG